MASLPLSAPVPPAIGGGLGGISSLLSLLSGPLDPLPSPMAGAIRSPPASPFDPATRFHVPSQPSIEAVGYPNPSKKSEEHICVLCGKHFSHRSALNKHARNKVCQKMWVHGVEVEQEQEKEEGGGGIYSDSDSDDDGERATKKVKGETLGEILTRSSLQASASTSLLQQLTSLLPGLPPASSSVHSAVHSAWTPAGFIAQHATSVSSNTIPIPLNGPFPIQIPCRARCMGWSHTAKTAFFNISAEPFHGMLLSCGHAECNTYKFAYCVYCRTPVAKRNFNKRHLHGLKCKVTLRTPSGRKLGRWGQG